MGDTTNIYELLEKNEAARMFRDKQKSIIPLSEVYLTIKLKNGGEERKNVGDNSKNVGDFFGFLRYFFPFYFESKRLSLLSARK